MPVASSYADVINKVGVVAYLAGSHMLEERIDVHSPDYARNVG